MRSIKTLFVLAMVAAGALVAAVVGVGAPEGVLPPTPGPTGTSAPDADPAEGRPAQPPTARPTPGTPSPSPTEDPTPGPDDPAPAQPDEPTDPVPERLEPGDEGPEVRELQERLRELGYWLGRADGVYGKLTTQAVYAFQGVEGLPRDGVATPEVRDALDVATRPEPESREDGLEVDLDEQVLRVVRDGEVALVFHVSAGSGETYEHPDGGTRVAETPRGEWTISWRVDGWRESSLGRLYRPAYFHSDGIAFHGYPEVPPEPASHGCVRVAMAAMDVLWAEGFVDEGERVLVQ